MAHLPGTVPLEHEGDLAAEMVAGIGAFLDRALAEAAGSAAGPEARRAELARRIGAVDPRLPVHALELVATTALPALRGRGPGFEVLAVRWPVLEGVDGEGLWLRPTGGRRPRARIVALPDADCPPERAPFAWGLAERGCEVLVPVLVDRAGRWSGGRPHREYLWRMAFEVGRHIIGYEVAKVLAAVDLWAGDDVPVGVFGYGEGGLLALHAAALDTRIAAAGVSGHFRDRSAVWREPVYRDVWGLLRGFGDADLAGLVAPRGLVVEAAPGPVVDGPPSGVVDPSWGGLSAGALRPAPEAEVRAEVERARPAYAATAATNHLLLIGPVQAPGSAAALDAFCDLLGPGGAAIDESSAPLTPVDAEARLHRQFRQLCECTQRLLRASERDRQGFWAGADRGPEAWAASRGPYRQRLWDEVIGRCPPPSVPARPRSRVAYDRPGWLGYEVVLDVWPGVFASGVLLLPRDLRPGERRPAVVCQHGLEGRARDTIEAAPDSPYRNFAARLAERGFVVYAPQNPYIGGERFRVLQRKAHPLGWSLFSVIAAQHARTLEWLGGLPWVDPARIGFYGLSYGGKTAMRVPALLPGYCLSICSADFNEWARKCASEDRRFTYLHTIEYDMYEFDLAHTFNYAEMAGLIAPRPFMVERGHHDGVGIDEWVAYEYAKVRRLYAELGIPERTEIAFFHGVHRIDGEASFAFLERHLGAPRGGAAGGDGGR